MSDQEGYCPKCSHRGAKILTRTEHTLYILCPYDCGGYLLPTVEWDEYQDEYDPTPWEAPVK